MYRLFFFPSSLVVFFFLALTVDLLSNLLFQTRGIAVRVEEVYFCSRPRDIRLGLKAGERVHDFSSDDDSFRYHGRQKRTDDAILVASSEILFGSGPCMEIPRTFAQ